jgi:hypothetical protein
VVAAISGHEQGLGTMKFGVAVRARGGIPQFFHDVKRFCFAGIARERIRHFEQRKHLETTLQMQLPGLPFHLRRWSFFIMIAIA